MPTTLKATSPLAFLMQKKKKKRGLELFMELYADKLCFVVYSPAILLQTLQQNGKQTTTKKPVVKRRRQCESIRFAKVKEKKNRETMSQSGD